jgi:hypothetical protein
LFSSGPARQYFAFSGSFRLLHSLLPYPHI